MEALEVIAPFPQCAEPFLRRALLLFLPFQSRRLSYRWAAGGLWRCRQRLHKRRRILHPAARVVSRVGHKRVCRHDTSWLFPHEASLDVQFLKLLEVCHATLAGIVGYKDDLLASLSELFQY